MKDHKRMKILRIKRELQAQDVAAQIGVSRAALSLYERYGVPLPGDGEAKLTRLLALATAKGAEGDHDH